MAPVRVTVADGTTRTPVVDVDMTQAKGDTIHLRVTHSGRPTTAPRALVVVIVLVCLFALLGVLIAASAEALIGVTLEAILKKRNLNRLAADLLAA